MMPCKSFYEEPRASLTNFHTILNDILLKFSTLCAGINLRQKKGVRFSTFHVIVVVDRSVHHLGTHGEEEFSLIGILLIISQHHTCRIVAYFQVLVMYLISDEEILVLYVLPLLAH